MQQDNLNRILNAFKIKAECKQYRKVRNVSLYDIVLLPGAKVASINKYVDELSLALKARSKPMLKLIPEQGIVRLEVVDEAPSKISFQEEIKKLSKPDYQLPMYLGSSIEGEDLWMDTSKNPHLLVAGCTGSGKSTLLHLLIANAIQLSNANICVIDSKNIEFGEYRQLDRFTLANDFVSAYRLLQFLHSEMEYRYSLVKNANVPLTALTNTQNYAPILLVIDEFADLVMQDGSEAFRSLLCRLTQKCRAAGIYCVLATQRPSADVLNGNIKANFPARIACQVASHIDSRIILDKMGAELLAGNGDAIIHNYNQQYTRFQIAHTTAKETVSSL